jgi:hypothetical protein
VPRYRLPDGRPSSSDMLPARAGRPVSQGDNWERAQRHS